MLETCRVPDTHVIESHGGHDGKCAEIVRDAAVAAWLNPSFVCLAVLVEDLLAHSSLTL